MTGRAFHQVNLALAFGLELCALAALGYWGTHTGGGPLAKTALGIGAPLLAAVLWGLFAAPKAAISVPPVKFAVEVLVFGSATMALYAAGHRALAAALAILVVGNSILVRR